MGQGRTFLRHMHYFRAFAIINIVAAHLWYIPSILETEISMTIEVVDKIREVLFHGSSIYFLFISGFLFSYLSSGFSVTKYWEKKIKFVLAPYFILSLLVFLISNIHSSLNSSLFVDFTHSIFVGSNQIQYWYIPFITLVFVISPIFLMIPHSYFKMFAVLVMVLPLLGTRTSVEMSYGLYLYFLPIYIFGMYFERNYQVCMNVIKGYWLVIASIAALSSIGLWFVDDALSFWFTQSAKETLFFIQKMSFCFLAVMFLEKFQNSKFALLNNLAQYSFAIYFTHMFIGNRGYSYISKVVYDMTPILIIPTSVLYVAFVIMLNLALCKIVKKLFGNYSKILIGV